MLIRQLYDRDGDVRNRALRILDERWLIFSTSSHFAVCQGSDMVLLRIMNRHPAVLHLKDAGAVVLGHYMSNKHGFETLLESGYI